MGKLSNYPETDESEYSESNNSDSSENETKQLWCICRSSDGSRFMICCDKCEEWYHGDCINITPKEADFIIKYYCAQCEKRDPTLKSVYKTGASLRKIPTVAAQTGKRETLKGKSETIFLKTGATDRNKVETEKKNYKSTEKIPVESKSIENCNKSEQKNRQLNIEKHQNPIAIEMRIKSEKVQTIKHDSKFTETLEAKNRHPIAKEVKIKSEKMQSIKPDSKFIQSLETKTPKIHKTLQDKLSTAVNDYKSTKATNEPKKSEPIKAPPKLNAKIQPKIKLEDKFEEFNKKIHKNDTRKCLDCVNCLRKSDCNTCINCKTKSGQSCLKRVCVKLKKIPENIVKTEKLTLTKLPGEFIPKKAVPAPLKKQHIRELPMKKEATCPSSPINQHEKLIKRVDSSSISSRSSNSFSINIDKKTPIANKLPQKNMNEYKSQRTITPSITSESGSNSTKTNEWIGKEPVKAMPKNRPNLLKRPLSPSRSSEDSYINCKKTKITKETLTSKAFKPAKIKAEPEVKNAQKRKLEIIDKSVSLKSQSSMETGDFSDSDEESIETYVNNKKNKIIKQSQKPKVQKGKKPKEAPVKLEHRNLLEEEILEPCLYPDCEYLRRIGSKYCSDECGIQLQMRRLELYLPERIKEWNSTLSYAERRDMWRKLDILRECDDIQKALEYFDKKNQDLVQLTRTRRLANDARDFPNNERRRVTSAEIRCVTCGDFIGIYKALSHMQICFQKIENRILIFADYEEQLMGSKLFCDFYDPGNKGYCKRLDALCEHTKDDSYTKANPAIICAYPLTENNEVNNICLTAKRECTRHINWERIQRAVIDMKRYRLLVKMEELKNEEIIIENSLFSRRSVLNLLLHRTIDHQPNKPMK